MDEVEVEVLEPPVGQTLAARGLDVLSSVVRVPKLGDDEQVLAFDKALGDGTRDAGTTLLLVGVVGRAVQKAVARLDGVVHLVGRDVGRHLPQAEAGEGHRVARLESDGGLGHGCDDGTLGGVREVSLSVMEKSNASTWS